WFPVSGIIIFRNTKNSNAFNWLKPEPKTPGRPLRKAAAPAQPAFSRAAAEPSAERQQIT
ncbi:hypothetical protein, partial [[Clostridium] symbiosum]|uniref:hypothetical protein n=1 Tax=Clostridium symbiosum TaxID=1512 RepID=UPI0034A4CA51